MLHISSKKAAHQLLDKRTTADVRFQKLSYKNTYFIISIN